MVASKSLQDQVADALRADIASGELAAGGRLPSERELGERFGAARNTVRLGLAVLVAEGLIYSEHGRGYFVRKHEPFTYYASRSESLILPVVDEAGDSFVNDIKVAGRVPTTQFTLAIEPASATAANALRVELGSSTVLRSVLRFVDGTPWSIQNTWYPMDLAEGTRLMDPRDIAEGTTRYLAGLGHEQVGYWDEWTTRMPTPDEARKLELGPGTPVLICVRTGFTTERPVRVTETIFAGDRNRIVYETGNLAARGDDE
jgi:GntR family transcriptional regulator